MDRDPAPEPSKSMAELNTVDLLFRYYQVLKQDLLLQTGSFKNHVRNSQIFGGAFIATMSLLVTKGQLAVSDSNVLLWILGMFTFITVTYYLIYDVLEATFAVRALEECLSFLEERLNLLLGANRLIWQTGVAQKLWPISWKELGFIPPMWGLQFYDGLLIAGATLFLPGLVIYQAWDISEKLVSTRSLLVLLMIYAAASAFFMIWTLREVNGRLRSKVRNMINEKWELALPVTFDKAHFDDHIS
jgi:hypothetical protein